MQTAHRLYGFAEWKGLITGRGGVCEVRTTRRGWDGRVLWGHAGHLTGCGGLLWTEHWWSGSDVGRLRGRGGGGQPRPGGGVNGDTQQHRRCDTYCYGLKALLQVKGTVTS